MISLLTKGDEEGVKRLPSMFDLGREMKFQLRNWVVSSVISDKNQVMQYTSAADNAVWYIDRYSFRFVVTDQLSSYFCNVHIDVENL